MPDRSRDPRVDAYLDGLVAWQRDLGARVRAAARAADPGITETVTRRVLPSFVCHGHVCALMGTRTHLNVFVYDPSVADPAGLFNQGSGNTTARAVQLFESDRPDLAALQDLFARVAARNRAGGWRRLGPDGSSAGPR